MKDDILRALVKQWRDTAREWRTQAGPLPPADAPCDRRIAVARYGERAAVHSELAQDLELLLEKGDGDG